VLLTLLATWIYLRFRETGKSLWLYASISALLMYTHYLAVFVLYQLFKKKLESVANLERKYVQT